MRALLPRARYGYAHRTAFAAPHALPPPFAIQLDHTRARCTYTHLRLHTRLLPGLPPFTCAARALYVAPHRHTPARRCCASCLCPLRTVLRGFTPHHTARTRIGWMDEFFTRRTAHTTPYTHAYTFTRCYTGSLLHTPPHLPHATCCRRLPLPTLRAPAHTMPLRYYLILVTNTLYHRLIPPHTL